MPTNCFEQILCQIKLDYFNFVREIKYIYIENGISFGKITHVPEKIR